MSRALGHADFYPNGGGGQPECYSGQFFVQLQSPLANLRTAKTVVVSAAKSVTKQEVKSISTVLAVFIH